MRQPTQCLDRSVQRRLHPCAEVQPRENPSHALDAGALERMLRAKIAVARGAWLGDGFDDGGFVRHLADVVRPGVDLLEAAEALHVSDLYLAYSCLKGKAWALRTLDDEYLHKLGEALRRFNRPHAFTEDVVQTLRIRLLVAVAPARPKLAEYAGQGALLTWLKAAAIRTGLDQLVTQRVQVPLSELPTDELPRLAPQPELELLRRRHRQEVDAAFEAALQSLSDREKTVLRLHAIDHLNIEKIGALFGVSRATAGRWLLLARTRLFEETRTRIQACLQLSMTEVESVMAEMRSGLQISLSRCLR